MWLLFYEQKAKTADKVECVSDIDHNTDFLYQKTKIFHYIIINCLIKTAQISTEFQRDLDIRHNTSCCCCCGSQGYEIFHLYYNIRFDENISNCYKL